jgi:hypothetical protein
MGIRQKGKIESKGQHSITRKEHVQENRPYTIPLNARQIARELLPKRSDEETIFEEFLLWPPDLFAFTSQILRITGAYQLVVSPPQNEQTAWPPKASWALDLKKGTPNWNKYVRDIGMTWRKRLENRFIEAELWAYKNLETIPNRVGKLSKLVGKPNSDNTIWEVEGDWVPKEVGRHWNTLRRGMQPDGIGNIEDILCEIEDDPEKLLENWKVFVALMTLHAIVDEACVGWGIRNIHYEKDELDQWRLHDDAPESGPAKFAENELVRRGTMATISNSRGRVLPKRHTPSLGITLRSLSHNLAFHSSSVEVKWRVGNKENEFTRRVSKASKNKIFSILLLPWPQEVSALDFKAAPYEGIEADPDKYGLFHYSPKKKWFDKNVLGRVLQGAQQEAEHIDMVILPECALTEGEIDEFERIIGQVEFSVSAYVAGVRGVAREGVFGDNMVYCKMGDSKIRKGERSYVTYDPPEMQPADIQYKHHRWKVDRFQIENYSLGHALSPFKNWWEAIKIRRRKVTFINVGNELTICPLICEDLARQDPIADLIRTVGPSLVITILMDGPQTKDRWPARYASVLSEDPGSAVITLTSVGMVDRWRRPHLQHRRVIALWNDGQGAEREIELEAGAVGVLLSLSISGSEEVSADGRDELYPTNRVILGGIRQIQ